MKQYEQLSFHKQLVTRQTNECLEQCLDRNGTLIHLGDYVRAVRGEPYLKNWEGLVEKISPYEDAGTYLKLVTLGGKVLDEYANPLFFEVVKE